VVEWEPRGVHPWARILRAELGNGLPIRENLESLQADGLVRADHGLISLTPAGADVRRRLQAAGRERLNVLLKGWDPDEHAEIREMVDELARSYASAPPRPRAALSS